MEIMHGYRNDKALRHSFNALAEQTFGLNFENWYRLGYWGDNYDPHSAVLDGAVVANVSVNRCDLVIGGKRRKIYQLGTVMTAPEHRGKGYIRAIMEYLDPILAEADGVYLFANDSVVDFYPRFGFRRAAEITCHKTVRQTGICQFTSVPMDTPENRARLADAMEASAFREGCPMAGNPELIFFYVSQFMRSSVRYSETLKAWVIADLEEGCLTLYNVFGPAALTLDAVIAAFGSEVQRVALAFSPADKTGWETALHTEADSTFFVRGDAFREFEALGLRIPGLAHA